MKVLAMYQIGKKIGEELKKEKTSLLRKRGEGRLILRGESTEI